VTNIPGDCVTGKRWVVVTGGKEIPGCEAYSDQPPGSAIALVGSHGWVEIAINCGDAQSELHLQYLDPVQVVF